MGVPIAAGAFKYRTHGTLLFLFRKMTMCSSRENRRILPPNCRYDFVCAPLKIEVSG